MVMGELPVETGVIVIGGGPAGYTAAFRAADLGLNVTLVTDEPQIAEGALAVEMGALAQDVVLTVHPHPTLSETVGEAAQTLLGSATHVFAPKK